MEEGRAYAGLTILALIAISSTIALIIGHSNELGPAAELDVESGKTLVLIKSSACRTCEKILPYWEAAKRSVEGVKLIEVAIEERPTLAVEYGIRETPTFLLFVNGRLVAKYEGPFGYNEGEFVDNLIAWVREKSLRPVLTFREAIALPSLFLLGLAVYASPCVLPLALSFAALLMSRGEKVTAARCSLCAVLAAVGVLIAGAVAGLLGAGATATLPVLTKVFAILLFAIGLSSILDLPMGSPKGLGRKGGFYGACITFGLLSVQCSLPLVLGALLAIASSQDVVFNAVKVLLFSSGLAIPFGATLALLSRGVLDVKRLRRRISAFHKVGGFVLVGLSIVLLL